ncbi:hypothetical protein TNCV_2798581 [Trichonephila clavipes]|nr:hypothetical protein TNCV_2798581 [Trichonephila clavipes]
MILPYVKNFDIRNDSSSLIKDYKCNKTKVLSLKLEYCKRKNVRDIVLCKKANGAMNEGSVDLSPAHLTPSPMNGKHRRFSVAPENLLSLGSGSEEKRNRL